MANMVGQIFGTREMEDVILFNGGLVFVNEDHVDNDREKDWVFMAENRGYLQVLMAVRLFWT